MFEKTTSKPLERDYIEYLRNRDHTARKVLNREQAAQKELSYLRNRKQPARKALELLSKKSRALKRDWLLSEKTNKPLQRTLV